MQSRWMLKVSFYFRLKGRRDLIPFVYRICSSDNKSWRCLVLPLKTAPKKLFWLMAVVEHVTCVCLDVCTGLWIWSFATASCLSSRFHFLLSLLLPRGLPVSVRAEKRFLVLFLRQSGLHSGQNLGVKNIFARAVVHLKINQRQWKSKKKKKSTKAAERPPSDPNLQRSQHLMLHMTLFLNVILFFHSKLRLWLKMIFFCLFVYLFCCAFVALPDGPVIWRMLTYPPTRRALLVGCGLHMFQQVSGINTIMWVKADIMVTSPLYECRVQGKRFLHLHTRDTQALVCKCIWRTTFCWIVTGAPTFQSSVSQIEPRVSWGAQITGDNKKKNNWKHIFISFTLRANPYQGMLLICACRQNTRRMVFLQIS